jgi:WD40 repeat protein
MTLDSTVLNYRRTRIDWALNCRYLIAMNIWTPDEPGARRRTSIYDTFTGQRIYQTGRAVLFETVWSPTRTQFLIKSYDGLYLMNESLPAPVLLMERHYYGNYMHFWEWDMARGQLLTSFWLNSGYLMIYDINTGATLATIGTPEGCVPSRLSYTRSADDRYLLVYAFRGNPACVMVYDRDTGTVVAEVNAELRSAAAAEQIAISPDGRYLIIGRQVLRVWDLSALPEKFEDRLPIYRHDGPERNIHSVRFVTNEIVETATLDGLTQWNILTGEPVSP